MTRRTCLIVLSCYLSLGAAPARAADEAVFDGEWRTSVGIVMLKQTGNSVLGSYGDRGQFVFKGTVEGKKFTFDFQEGQALGEAHWTIDEAGDSFQGAFKIRGGQSGIWQGWRLDPTAPDDKRAKVGGLWLTDRGLMELQQTDEKEGAVCHARRLRDKRNAEGTPVRLRVQVIPPRKGLVRRLGRWQDLRRRGCHWRFRRLVGLARSPSAAVRPPSEVARRQDHRRVDEGPVDLLGARSPFSFPMQLYTPVQIWV